MKGKERVAGWQGGCVCLSQGDSARVVESMQKKGNFEDVIRLCNVLYLPTTYAEQPRLPESYT